MVLDERQQDLRWNYVTWYAPLPPFLAIEVLSPGTETEDLGTAIRTRLSSIMEDVTRQGSRSG